MKKLFEFKKDTKDEVDTCIKYLSHFNNVKICGVNFNIIVEGSYNLVETDYNDLQFKIELTGYNIKLDSMKIDISHVIDVHKEGNTAIVRVDYC